MTNLTTLRTKYQIIFDLLETLYGFPAWRQHLPPVDELIDCILSQNTSDLNRDKAFEALKARFPTWEAVCDAPVEEVIDLIRPAGLSQTKGPVIQNVLREIQAERGMISLDFLAKMDTEQAKRWLTHFNGVGPKTAAIVLLFAFNKPAFPVDTHVHRVTQRLGLIGPKTSREQAHVVLEAIIPPEQFYQAHLNMIQHGRTVCQARRPLCERCPLTGQCDYYQQVIIEGKFHV
ncbi:MAG: endonuclease III [Chloroflexota bacterium]